MKFIKKNDTLNFMRIFVYKSLFIFISLFVLYKITIGSSVKTYEKKLESVFSKENTEFYKSKIRKEIKSAIKKDRILSESDAKLINEFIKKLNKELIN